MKTNKKMQEQIKKIIIKASIFTTDPDKDWRRLFVGLVCVLFGVSIWSFFFYSQITTDIMTSEIKQVKGVGAAVSEQEDELHTMVEKFESKKKKNESIVEGGADASLLRLQDPSLQ